MINEGDKGRNKDAIPSGLFFNVIDSDDMIPFSKEGL